MHLLALWIAGLIIYVTITTMISFILGKILYAQVNYGVSTITGISVYICAFTFLYIKRVKASRQAKQQRLIENQIMSMVTKKETPWS